MFTTLYGGLPIAAYGGMFLFLLLVLQVLGGLKLVKMPLIWHKRLAIVIIFMALIHGILTALYFLG